MKKFKHSKFKNTGILFNLLTQQLTTDVLTNSTNKSIQIVKEFFKNGTELQKELECYQLLTTASGKKDAVANKLIEITIERRKDINHRKLAREKFNLIKEIKRQYDADAFFEARIPEYKLYASIYKLFEFKSADNPSGHIDSYATIMEHITSVPGAKPQLSEEANALAAQPADIQKLVTKTHIKAFNEKYRDVLDTNQRTLVSRYINEGLNSPSFKTYVFTEVKSIGKQLNKIHDKLVNENKDLALKLKIKEVTKLLNEIVASKRLKDEHMSAMIKYYELINHLG